MLVKSVFAALAAAGMATAHIEMTSPYPIRSQHDPQNDWNNIDYSMTSPLNSDGSNFPCKGYHKNTPFRATAQYKAGSSYSMSLSGGATHSGGSCQLSLSYDNGATFKVIKSMEGGCPLTSQYDFTIPSGAPSGDALFAWTWFNLEGNREMYMNCADVTVEGGSGGGSWSSLPDLFAANVGNGCSTVEGKHTVFANPGNDVVYGQGLGPNSPVFPNC